MPNASCLEDRSRASSGANATDAISGRLQGSLMTSAIFGHEHDRHADQRPGRQVAAIAARASASLTAARPWSGRSCREGRSTMSARARLTGAALLPHNEQSPLARGGSDLVLPVTRRDIAGARLVPESDAQR